MAWLHIHFISESLGMPVPMEVLLPQYIAGGTRAVKYPGPYQTLYLLHGMGDDHTSLLRRTSIERYVENLPLAVVMPAGHISWYTDMAYGKNYFKFITEELPALCERMFPLSNAREDRFIAGFSMGGYGAIKAGLLASDTFSSAASFSGGVDVMDCSELLGENLFNDIFGNKENLKYSDNNLFVAAEHLAASNKPRSQLYMWCGTEDFFYDANVRFKQHALKLGLPLTYEDGPGNHECKYWDMCIQRILKWLPIRKSDKGVL